MIPNLTGFLCRKLQISYNSKMEKPGEDLIREGLTDLRSGRESIPSPFGVDRSTTAQASRANIA